MKNSSLTPYILNDGFVFVSLSVCVYVFSGSVFYCCVCLCVEITWMHDTLQVKTTLMLLMATLQVISTLRTLASFQVISTACK